MCRLFCFHCLRCGLSSESKWIVVDANKNRVASILGGDRFLACCAAKPLHEIEYDRLLTIKSYRKARGEVERLV